MANSIPSPTLPTLSFLGSTLDSTVGVHVIAHDWFTKFSRAIDHQDVPSIVALCLDGVYWRDMLAFTWDFRIFHGKNAVSQFLADQLGVFTPRSESFSLQREYVQLERPFDDVAWIQASFNSKQILVPLPDGSWKAHVVYTNLEDLKGFPEQIGPHRNHSPDHGKWGVKREREREFLDAEPTVVVVGAGQSGLDAAARLKMLGISALVVERHKRIGDNWRTRYAALCLHDPGTTTCPICPSWPVYTPALKLADWLESYAHTLELNVWTSATVVGIERETGDSGKRWSVQVDREDGRTRMFKVDHVVFALGLGSGLPHIPNIPGQDTFEGQILHSFQYGNATDHLGKKVAVIGACTSAHDICSDYVAHSVDVTMVQRGPTYIISTKEGMPRFLALHREGGSPTDFADRVSASYPSPLVKLVHQRVTKDVAEVDKVLLDGLRRVGFKLTLGEDDSGPVPLGFKRGGGYYFDIGASQLIIDQKIKLKSDGPIKAFTPTGLLFEDGSKLDVDVVLFATGLGDAHRVYLDLIKNVDLHDKMRKIVGCDNEGELRGLPQEITTREAGDVFAGLWCMTGNLAMCRFHSKHLALQIKAYQEGVFGVRYNRGN